MEKTVSPLFLGCFPPVPLILPGNDDMHESSDDFEFRPGWTTDFGVSCKIRIDPTTGVSCP